MVNDAFDNLLEDVCANNWRSIAEIEEIEAPEFNLVMDRLVDSINTRDSRSSNRGLLLRPPWLRRVAGFTMCIVLGIILSSFSQIPQIHAFRSRVIQTIIRVVDNQTTIQNTSVNYESLPRNGAPPSFFTGEYNPGNPPIDDSDIVQVTPHRSYPETYEHARKLISGSFIVLGHIPDGYTLEEIVVETFPEGIDMIRVEHTYSSGDEMIYFYQTIGTGEFASSMTTESQVETINVMGQNGILVSGGGVSRVSWYGEDYDGDITAWIPREEMLRIVAGLEWIE